VRAHPAQERHRGLRHLRARGRQTRSWSCRSSTARPSRIALERAGPCPEADAIEIGVGVARARWSPRTRSGIVHRDLKPSNIFLHTEPGSREVTVKVLDFGISKILSRDEASYTDAGRAVGSPRLHEPRASEGRGRHRWSKRRLVLRHLPVRAVDRWAPVPRGDALRDGSATSCTARRQTSTRSAPRSHPSSAPSSAAASCETQASDSGRRPSCSLPSRPRGASARRARSPRPARARCEQARRARRPRGRVRRSRRCPPSTRKVRLLPPQGSRGLPPVPTTIEPASQACRRRSRPRPRC
jgi:serine/threonine protein kinase